MPAPARLGLALIVAVGLALPFMVSEIAGIATWKIVLGVLGIALYAAGSRTRSAS